MSLLKDIAWGVFITIVFCAILIMGHMIYEADTPIVKFPAEDYRGIDQWSANYLGMQERAIQVRIDCVKEMLHSPTASTNGPNCREDCKQEAVLVKVYNERPAHITMQLTFAVDPFCKSGASLPQRDTKKAAR